MAVNPDTGHEKAHLLLVAATGGGKSQALRNKILPKRGARVIVWDLDEDHQVTHFDNRAAFARALVAGLKSGRGFRLGWNGGGDLRTFEWFCRLCWEALDGAFVTWVVVEELADVSPSAGKASHWFGILLRRSRKYGGRIVATTQRGQEISKTVFNQVSARWLGQQEGQDLTYIANAARVPIGELEQLKPLEFLVKPSGAVPHTKEIVKYRAVSG